VAAPSRREPEPGSSCGRALECCRAYTSVISDVVEASACVGVYEALDAQGADARCLAMTLGWRSALERARGEAPEPCL
jgi:hypothetical protein